MAGTFAAWRARGAPGRWKLRAPAIPAWRRRARTTRWREGDGERFLDIVVIVSVVLFMILATGVGILALQNSLR